MLKLDPVVTKNLNGSHTISDIIDNYRKAITYYGYTKREAMKKYKQEIGKAL